MQKFSPRALFIIAGLLVALIVIGAIVISTVNSRAGTEVDRVLREMVADSDLRDVVEFGEVDVQTPRGRITIPDIRFDTPEAAMRVEDVSITVPVSEAASFARNPEAAVFSEIDILVRGARFEDLSTELSFRIDELSLSFAGDLSERILESPEIFFDNVAGAGFSLSEAWVDPSEEIEMQLQMMFGGASWITRAENWGVEHLAADLIIDDRGVHGEDLSVQSPVIRAHGSTAMTVRPASAGEPGVESMSVRLDVDDLDEEIRRSFTELFAMFGQRLPQSGSFRFELDVQEGRQPRVRIE